MKWKYGEDINMSEFPVLKAKGQGDYKTLAGAIMHQVDSGNPTIEVVAIGEAAWMTATKALIHAVSIANSKGIIISQTNPEFVTLNTDRGEISGLRMVIYRLDN